MNEYEYLREQRYFAIVTGSLERHAADEAAGLGARIMQPVPRGFSFCGDQAALYRVIISSRLIQRVLAPLASFVCHTEKQLYKKSRELIDWPGLFPVEKPFGIQSNVSGSKITHSLYAGQLLKDAICDSFRERGGQRPNFSTRDADLFFNLHLKDNKATISLDLCGKSMHKRGYRWQAGPAPLQETLAALLVHLSGWDKRRVFLDPMCGSGTILAEALMSACNVPASYLRKDSGYQFLPDHDATLFEKIRAAANSQIKPLPEGLIQGSDIQLRNVEIARQNLASLPYGELVELKASRFQDLDRQEGRLMVTNPPYGVRLGDENSIKRLYNELGDFLKQKCPASESYILCGDKTLVPELRLRAHWKKNLKNGDLEVALAKILVR